MAYSRWPGRGHLWGAQYEVVPLWLTADGQAVGTCGVPKGTDREQDLGTGLLETLGKMAGEGVAMMIAGGCCWPGAGNKPETLPPPARASRAPASLAS